RNIRCNAVCPGTIDSPWIEKILASAPDKAVKRKQMENRQLIKRMGTPAEIAHAILFLASPQSSFIHGSAMLVDGGMTAV
ncbi:MAG: SDR family oxidoreductase, partial [Desulfobacteraceae bacterium]|nr:SDR family oxidoreductase [Desulfobacteraceae bacterium]